MRGNRSSSTGRGRRWFVPVAVAAGLVVAACGGGSSSKKSASGLTATTEQPAQQATSDSSTTVPGETTTTAAGTSVTAGGTTGTTARKTTATTTRKNSLTQITTVSKGVTAGPAGGIAQVTTTAPTAPRADITPGGTLTWLRSGDVQTLDPLGFVNNGATDGPPGFAIYDMLVWTDGGVVQPQVATSLTSSDGLVWTMKIQPNMKFTDGTSYDSSAIKFNYQRLADPANHASRAAQAQMISKMDTPDPTTIVLTLKAKNALFPQAVALIPFIGSPTAIQQMGNDKFANNPVGAGPFVLKSWQRDSQMVLTRNQGYWNSPRPYLDQLVIKPIQDETQRVNTFCTGGGNLVHMTSSANADSTQSRNCGNAQPLVLNGGINIIFNVTKPPMDNPKLRQAVALGIDRTDLAKVTTNNIIPPLNSIFRTDSPFFDSGIQQQGFDKAKAQALFDEVAATSGGTVTIPIQSFGTGAYGAVGQYVQAALSQYNHVKTDFTVNSTGQQVTVCTQRQYTGICVFGNIFDDPDPTWTSLYTCSSASNYTGYCNAKFDQDVADNEVTLDPKQRINDIKDAQKQVYADTPSVFLQGAYTWMFTKPEVQDFHYGNDGLPMIDRIWIKSK